MCVWEDTQEVWSSSQKKHLIKSSGYPCSRISPILHLYDTTAAMRGGLGTRLCRDMAGNLTSGVPSVVQALILRLLGLMVTITLPVLRASHAQWGKTIAV